MSLNRFHFRHKQFLNPLSEPSFTNRKFWWLFKKKGKEKAEGRPGAMSPQAIKQKINELGIGSQIEITRIGYDGSIDDMPIIVEVIDITEYGFTGRFVNVERQMIESATEKLVYAKKGGGIIEFRYDDGDIKDITVSKDVELLQQERDVEALREVLTALETGDNVIVAYYDNQRRGTINTEGVIVEKSEDNNAFTIQIEKINRIELEKKSTKKLDIRNDLVIDIEFV